MAETKDGGGRLPDAASGRSSGESSVEAKLHLASFEGSFVPSARPVEARTVPWFRDREYLVGGWRTASVWRSALVEGVAAACLIYTSGQTAATLMSYESKQLGSYIGISSAVLLALFIYATAPATGGHINPMITFSSILAGLCPVSRGVLYMCGQTIGAALAGGLLTGVWGRERSISVHGGGCFYDPAAMTAGRVFLAEVVGSFVLLYLSYGVGLDPRQAALFGPRLGPLLVGVTLGLVSFSTSGVAPGYAGAQMNPARCFAFGIARRDLSDQWIWWFGPAAGSVLLAALYLAIPPHHAGREAARAGTKTIPRIRDTGV
ncbi:hypothetical protein CDD83_9041 [Cordyceps sp. RAO-2017]|nr:hypothetical protein CDD83_9041 [Cordyceps sp. RAO-2017]